LLKKNVILMSW